MVFIGHYPEYPEELAREGFYRIEPHSDGGWDVHLDPPANPLGAPLVEPIDKEMEN